MLNVGTNSNILLEHFATQVKCNPQALHQHLCFHLFVQMQEYTELFLHFTSLYGASFRHRVEVSTVSSSMRVWARDKEKVHRRKTEGVNE